MLRAGIDIVRDLGLAVLTVCFGVLALVTPTRSHRIIVGAVASVSSLFGDADRRRLIVEQSFCRGYGVFRRGWPAEVTVSGLEHFRAAHDEGHGVVMWMMGFLDQTALNLALADAGHPVTFLSAEHHGVYSTRAPSRYLAAPILTRGAHRSMEQAIIIPEDGNKSYIRTLCRILEQDHGTVGMKGDVTDQAGALEASYRGQSVGFPTGAASLAHMTGAPLLTGAVIRHDTLVHEVVIDEPIAVVRSLGHDEYLEAVVGEFAHRLEQRLAAHPDSRPASRFDKPSAAPPR